MNNFLPSLLVAAALGETFSLGGLALGARWINHSALRRLGALAHAKKMRSLESVWPLTRIRPAVARGDVAGVMTIITALVALKSAACLIFGIVAVFWLPVASVIVPAIAAAEDPDDPELALWVQGVARLQVTSHVVAAALGFAVMVAGPLAGLPLGAVLGDHPLSTLAALALSAGFAVAAGRREAMGVVRRGQRL